LRTDVANAWHQTPMDLTPHRLIPLHVCKQETLHKGHFYIIFERKNRIYSA